MRCIDVNLSLLSISIALRDRGAAEVVVWLLNKLKNV